MKIKTINITDKITTREAERVSEIVTDALRNLGVNGAFLSWNLEVDYELTKGEAK